MLDHARPRLARALRGWPICVMSSVLFVGCIANPSGPDDAVGRTTSADEPGRDRDRPQAPRCRGGERRCRPVGEPDGGEADASRPADGSATDAPADADAAVEAEAGSDADAQVDAADDADAQGSDAEAAEDAEAADAAEDAEAADTGSGDDSGDAAPTGCLAEGVYHVPVTTNACDYTHPFSALLCPAFPCSTTQSIAEIDVIDDPVQGWVANYVAPSAFPNFAGRYAIASTASGFSAALSISLGSPCSPFGPLVPFGEGSSSIRFTVDCTTGNATLSDSCMARTNWPCAMGTPYVSSGSGTCEGCSASNVAGTSLTGVVALAGGAGHTCALLSGGTVDCWGASNAMQLGQSTLITSSASPLAVPGLTGVTAIAAGGQHTCALLEDGTVRCWGANPSGELGDGATTASATPMVVSGIAGATAIAAGAANTCALLADGSVACWGDDASGQLGPGASGPGSPTPVVVSGVSGARSIAVGAGHACAVLSDGSVECWGQGDHGQLGDGTGATSAAPVVAAGVAGAVQVAAGDLDTCALLAGGTVDCWGQGSSGQLGNGGTADAPVPGPVAGLTDATAIAAGAVATCAVRANRTLTCWGRTPGQLTDRLAGDALSDGGVFIAVEAIPPSTTPVPVFGLTATAGVAGVTVGSDAACAALPDGTARCWGANGSGQLGTADTTPYATPTVVGAAARINLSIVSSGAGGSIVAGGNDTCSNGAGGLACWGENSSGQLGNGTTDDSSTPVPVFPSGVTKLGMGGSHSCAIGGSGLTCWGDNSFGELGTGTTVDSSTPVVVSPLIDPGGANETPIAVLTGAHHTCAAGNLGPFFFCWGDNQFGQFGDGTTTSSAVPVAHVTQFLALGPMVAGDYHICQTTFLPGQVACWGLNTSGQLGGGPTPISATPVVTTVAGAAQSGGITALAAGAAHTCALVSNYLFSGTFPGTQAFATNVVECWGDNTFGERGSAPGSGLAYGLSGVGAIAAGGHHTCALEAGAVYCWGENTFGELGDGTTTQSPVPVAVRGISTAVAISAGTHHSCATLADGRDVCWGDDSHGQLGDGAPIVSPADAGTE
jgi:alpha-tubulin suppressor-like RCC1 family protein